MSTERAKPARPPRLTGAALAAALGERIGYVFGDAERLQRALTHASARGSEGADYERFEFLGDRVLGLVVADMLFHTFPGADEGELSRRLNALVNAETCAEIAEEIGLHEFVLAGKELKALTGRKRTNLRADVMEALIAAVYLDGGMEAARRMILAHWEKRAENVLAARRDAKTGLQEWAHQKSGIAPVYEVESRKGPDHDPEFTVMVRVDGYEPARGLGRSKREAEQAAAAALLMREAVWETTGQQI